MTHEIILQNADASLDGGTPFSFVRMERMSLRKDGIFVPTTIGTRCIGLFTYTGDCSAEVALDAVGYGLMKAQFRLTDPASPDFAPLYTHRLEELLAAANEALTDADSPCRLNRVVFRYVDCCIPDAPAENRRYSGFIMGQMGRMRQVEVYSPRGIPGEWQCVCGNYSAPGEVCDKCGIARPRLAD